MKTLREPLRFLDREEMATIHCQALRILAEIGMRIDHEVALDALHACGCRVDRGGCRVFFPEAVVQGVEPLSRSR
jgi:trimethylamine:corrinoid methyltransferase-like protein